MGGEGQSVVLKCLGGFLCSFEGWYGMAWISERYPVQQCVQRNGGIHHRFLYAFHLSSSHCMSVSRPKSHASTPTGLFAQQVFIHLSNSLLETS